MADGLAGGSNDYVMRLFEIASSFKFLLIDCPGKVQEHVPPSKTGSLSHLGLAACGVGRAEARIGAVALGRGIARGGALEALDLRDNELTPWAAAELARVLAALGGRCRLVDIKLEGNPAIEAEWLWRDHARGEPRL